MTNVEISFHRNYSMDMKSYWDTFVGFASFFIALTAVVSWWRYKQWSLRNTRAVSQIQMSTDFGGFSWNLLLEMSRFIADTGVKIYFVMIVLTSWYYFVVYKMQSSPSNIMPPISDIQSMYDGNSPYFPFVAGIWSITLIHTAYVMLITYNQISADLIFLDWEPSR